jgi:hypothetical protein
LKTLWSWGELFKIFLVPRINNPTFCNVRWAPNVCVSNSNLNKKNMTFSLEKKNRLKKVDFLINIVVKNSHKGFLFGLAILEQQTKKFCSE